MHEFTRTEYLKQKEEVEKQYTFTPTISSRSRDMLLHRETTVEVNGEEKIKPEFFKDLYLDAEARMKKQQAAE